MFSPFSRRELLRFGAGVPASLIAAQSSWSQEPLPSLKRVAESVGLVFGSDSDVEFDRAPPEYAALFASQCAVYAANMSWSKVCPTRAPNCPTVEDQNVAFAREHRLRLTGAHLLWHQRTPSWFDELSSRADAENAAHQHITAMISRYKGEAYSWNVVNEALNPNDHRADKLRNCALLEKLGPDYVTFAFRVAGETDTKALLVYNDYNMEMDRPDHQARRDGLLELIDKIQQAKARIDAVGLQSHIRLDGSRFNPKLYRDFLRSIAERGLKIMITEMDVLDVEPAGDIQTRDKDVAAMYREFLSVALDEKAVVELVIWGLSDNYTWLKPEYDKRFARADGQPARPLLFDRDLKPKPAFYAVVDAMRAASPRPH